MLAGALALAVFLIWLYAVLLPWRVERLAGQVDSGAIALTEVPALPGADAAPRIAARRLMLPGPSQALWERPPGRDAPTGLAAEHIERSLAARPLYAPTWLARAELALSEGDRRSAAAYAATAARLWPTRPELQWQVAMFQVRLGDAATALRTLRAYLAAEPAGLVRAAAVARRLAPDREGLVRALVPAGQGSGARAALLAALAGFARHTGDVALADAVWSAEPALQRDETMVFPYIELMIASAQRERAVRAWGVLRAEQPVVGRITNGGFESAPANGGLGWRLVRLDGTRAARSSEVAHGGGYALEIRFDGTANPDYYHAYQVVPIEGSRGYRVRGWWRGEAISTRSGVFIELVTDGAQRAHGRSEARFGSWNWEMVEASVEAPDDARFLTVRVRRARTDSLDKLISGRVWFDDFSLEQTDESAAGAHLPCSLCGSDLQVAMQSSPCGSDLQVATQSSSRSGDRSHRKLDAVRSTQHPALSSQSSVLSSQHALGHAWESRPGRDPSHG